MKKSLITLSLFLSLCACTKPAVVTPPPTSGTGATAKLSYPEVLVKGLNGDHGAEFELGAMFHDGDGIDQDYAKAIEWYKKSATAGNRQAAYNLALMYKNGEGTKVDLDAAHGWLVRSSDGGDVRAMYQLGQMAYTGKGDKLDFNRAYQYYLKAAMGGLADAEMNVGVMNIRTEGVPAQDLVEGYAWLKVAQEAGSARAATLFDTLAKQMTDEDKKKGDARATAIKAEIKKNAGPSAGIK